MRALHLTLLTLTLCAPGSAWAGNVVEQETDADGRVVRSVEDDGTVTRYRYQPDGDVKIEVDRGADIDLDTPVDRVPLGRDGGASNVGAADSGTDYSRP